MAKYFRNKLQSMVTTLTVLHLRDERKEPSKTLRCFGYLNDEHQKVCHNIIKQGHIKIKLHVPESRHSPPHPVCSDSLDLLTSKKYY